MTKPTRRAADARAPAAAPEAATPAAEAAEVVGGGRMLGWDRRGHRWSELQQLEDGATRGVELGLPHGDGGLGGGVVVDGLCRRSRSVPPPLLSESSSAVVAAVAAATPPPAEAVLASAAVSLFTPPVCRTLPRGRR